MAALTAWSYSRWAAWERCPMAFKAQFLDKSVPMPSSQALDRGRVVHADLAKWFMSDQPVPLPAEGAKFQRLLNQLATLKTSAHIETEQQWGFNSRWQPTTWFGNDTWLRVILDVNVVYADDTADVIDYKTGKPYDDNRDQMELFALAVMSRYPAVHQVATRLWYLDTGDEVPDCFTANDVPRLRAKWEERAAQMFADQEFPAKPNDKCKFCPLRRSAGGPCKFG